MRDYRYGRRRFGFGGDLDYRSMRTASFI